MNNRSSALVNQGFKGSNLTASKDSNIGIKKRKIIFRQFIIKFADIAVTIFLVAVLISAFMQPLFRDLLLDWLRNILENN
jgi:magnesium-transporting ATPase (P-type)